MELTDRLSSLTLEQQLKVMERVFQRLLLAFGNQMQAKWQGIDMQAVYQDWAESLQNYSLGAIDCGVKKSRAETHPPSQGEFLKFCQQYKPPVDESKMLEYDGGGLVSQEVARERLAELKKKLAESVAKMTEPA